MNNLNTFEKGMLDVLLGLERCCQIAELNKIEVKSGIKVTFGDIDFSTIGENIDNIYLAEKYLQEKGFNFSVTFKDKNGAYAEYTRKYSSDIERIELGVIKGENITTKIKELIREINSEKLSSKGKNALKEEVNHPDEVFTRVESGIGYLILYSEKIPIGEAWTGKFRLVETMCDRGLGKSKTIDVVFDYIKVKKDKNKTDVRLEDSYLASNRKLELIDNQMREVNRAISEYVKNNGLKRFKYRLKVESDPKNNTIWIKNKVGRRG